MDSQHFPRKDFWCPLSDDDRSYWLDLFPASLSSLPTAR